MAKSLEKTKAGLKLRTSPKGSLVLNLGRGKKYTLPFEARLLQSEGYVFIHIPPSAEIFSVANKEFRLVTDDAEAEKAAGSFRRSRKGSARSAKSTELPADLKAALSKIPAGHKIAYTPSGDPKLVKTRRRRKA
ncbi:MAG: hypothetical protein KF857_05765 [Fimbriimonadaceae bacterium]|nr:hypothetical protein [Fimbriimonadaceae bacterium]